MECVTSGLFKSAGLHAIRRFLHDLRHQSHHLSDRHWQRSGAGGLRVVSVAVFVGQHLFEDAAALVVVSGQGLQMFLQMFADLFLGFGNEAEAPFVAREASQRANAER